MPPSTRLKLAAAVCGVIGLSLHSEALTLACLLIGLPPMIERLRGVASPLAAAPHLLPLTLPALIHPNLASGLAIGMTVWAIFEVADESLGLRA